MCLRPAATWAVPRCRCKEMPAYLPNAFIAIEDRRFYQHYGVDPSGIVRAVIANVLHHGVAQGGSTITQQLAKNLFLTPERHLMRKLQETVLALWLERKFTKRRSSNCISTASISAPAPMASSRRRSAISASRPPDKPAEAALLAGLVKSPSRLAPTADFDAAERRSQRCSPPWRRPASSSEATDKAAMAAAPAIVKQSAGGSSNYVADWVMDVLNESVGRVEEDIVIETTHRCHAPGRRRKGTDSKRWPRSRPSSASARRAGGDDAGRRGARAGRRAQLWRESSTIVRSPRSASPARHSSRSSISPRWRTADAGHPGATTGRSRSKAGGRKISVTNI